MRCGATTIVLAACAVAALGLCTAPTATAAPGHLEGYLPSAAHTAGRFGSFWTTDVWIYHQGATRIHLWFNRIDSDNSDVTSVVIDLDDPVTRLEDVVAGTFGADGVGSIHYQADGPVTVVSRTWTATADGDGSYGQTIPGVPLAAASVPGLGQAGTLRMVVDQVPGFRANLGIVNMSATATTVAVEIFTADGAPAPGSTVRTVELDPFSMTQLNGVLDGLDPATRRGLIVRVGVTSDDGAVTAYLSTVDNATNDASYQQAFRFGG